MQHVKCRLIWVMCLLLILSNTIHAQNKYTISGYVLDSLSGESMIGATINVQNELRGVTTNQYGFFSITLPKGDHHISFSYVGYV